MHNSDYNHAMEAGKRGAVLDWTIEFLEGAGNNKSLAKTLRQKGQFHIGPIDYPIGEFVQILGPDKSFKFYEDQQTLNNRVTAMEKSFSLGWKPAPLIVTNIWEDYLEIADGGHRFELLQKRGVKNYPTIFYFKSQSSLDKFVNQLDEL